MGTDMIIRTLLLSATLLLGSSISWAADDSDEPEAELTIRLMGAAEATLPEAVTKELSLPEAANEDSVAVENAEQGLETANENKMRREEGLARADEARERGSEMADEAQDNRENRGRSEDHPEPPNQPGPPGT